MDEDFDLKDFDNVCRLFPLPGVVLFPHSVMRLHIFEPRYRQMTEDALASDRLITIVQVRPPSDWDSSEEPSLEKVGCLGRIFKHDRLPDGRFNFLLLGRKRVQLTREIPSGKLYRTSEVRIIEDVAASENGGHGRAELIALFRKVHQGSLDPDLDSLFESDLPLGVLTDIITQAMGLSSSIKQGFLAEPRVGRRAAELLGLLRRIEDRPPPDDDGDDDTSPFPPPFSLN